MSKVVEAEAGNWEKEVLRADKPVVVDFWHQMCGWCIKLNIIYEQLPDIFEGRVKFVKLNVLQSPENQKHAINLGVLATPILKFFCDGREVGEIVGYRPLERLVKDINEILNERKECLEQSSPLEV